MPTHCLSHPDPKARNALREAESAGKQPLTQILHALKPTPPPSGTLNSSTLGSEHLLSLRKAAAATPLAEADVNRVTAPNSAADAAKPAPKSRKRKSDAVEASDDAPAPKKATTTKKKKDDDPLPDLSGIALPGDDDMSVPIYDSCQTVRTKINARLRKPAAFLRACVKAAYGADSEHKIAGNLLTNFLAKKGPTAGNTSSVFYAAYVFFEKLRIRDGKPKNKTHEEMEARWGPDGFDREHDSSRGYFCAAGTAPVVDKYGRVSIVPTGGGRGRARGGVDFASDSEMLYMKALSVI
ncbi:calcineurin is a calcium-dependent [Colletotrichum asianum]